MTERILRCGDRHPDGGVYCALPAGHDGDHEDHRANGCYAEFIHWPQRKRGNPNFRSLSDDEKTVRVMVSMPASLRDWLRQQPGSSDSEKARRLLERCEHDRNRRLLVFLSNLAGFDTVGDARQALSEIGGDG